MEEIKIREAKREDCKAITNLIQELADFEKMPDGPKIDGKDSSGKSDDVKLEPEILEEDGFNSEHPLFNCYVATAGEKIIGYALYYYIYSTWTGKAMYLEDLYVSLDFRKNHIGSMLFKTVAKKAVDTNCSKLDFIVLNWNPAQDFYKNKGAVNLTEHEGWQMYRVEGAALKNLGTTV